MSYTTPMRNVWLTAVTLTLGVASAYLVTASGWVMPRASKIPVPAVQAVNIDPYEQPVLRAYATFRDAAAVADIATLDSLARQTSGSYLSYQTLLFLGRHPDVNAAARSDYLRLALDAHVRDPLARGVLRGLWLEYAQASEQAGYNQAAISAYREALPLAEAFQGLERLETRPLALANIFLQENQYRNALRVLDGAAVPSIEAPAYEGVGDYESALDAYDRWLAEIPSDATALTGRAWTLLSLGRLDEAETAFNQLSTPARDYGRGIIALRRGDIDRAVNLYVASGDVRYLWNATSLLEDRDRSREALPIYLQLAATDATTADDAAYRAYILASRFGDEASRARAGELLADFSFFGWQQGRDLGIRFQEPLPHVRVPVMDVASALARIGRVDAAVGELIYALQGIDDQASALVVIEMLQDLGEFRQSQRAAERWWRGGVRDARTWQATYPQAFPQLVTQQAQTWNVDPALVWAVMREESRFYPNAVSWANAQGLMQVIPSTWNWIAELLGETPGDPFNIEHNIRYGTYYLSRLQDRFNGDLERVVPSYNGGQGYIARLFEAGHVAGNHDDFYRFIDKPETREYLQKVMLSYAVYKTLYN